ncbi:AAA family ATPase [Nocardioides piscis]|uniref:Nuclease SbcCD subunit C n=1 Tax=Nocardioides piscis TaxID=2714938 RepID=A0A6G7YI35_9ACTN|nr:SMC family ATPase [Nocardioides piscis]QIK76472.1 SMC family ATPase [Nocardioides piscis]
MRLHSLDITAFGPFAETVSIDFDALSGSGLFLLSGPTGAGKSSILDAVCFALYGDVPGDRSTAGRLRCDQAAAGVAPHVRLEVTLSGRRFRIERSPKWERPKKRGSGLTTEQASVVISERTEGAWRPLSTRLDETGHLVTGLVGLTLSQFCQVAMLPQGRFQAFLRARSEDRHALLRQVFRTGRFDRIEQWLRERRLELQRSSASHARGVAQVIGRVSETAGQALPERWDLADLSAPAAEGDIATWVHDRLEQAQADAAESVAGAARADAAVEESAAAVSQAASLISRQDAHAEALRRLAEHDVEELQHQRLRLARAERAQPLWSLADTLEKDADQLERLRATATAATRTWCEVTGTLDHEPSYDELPRLMTQASRAVDRAEAARPEAERLLEVTRLCDEVERHLVEATTAERRLADEAAAVPAMLREAERSAAQAETAQQQLTATTAELDATRLRAAAALELVSVSASLRQAQTERDAARVAVTDLKETWLTIREARLEGMAAEIAGALTVGCGCPVCGSPDHPRPATARAGSPDAAADRAARKDVDDAEADLLVRNEQVRELETSQTRLATQSDGRSVAAADEELAAAERKHAETSALAQQTARLQAEVARLRRHSDDQREAHEAARQRVVDLTSRLALHTAERNRLRTCVSEVLSGSGCSTVGELVRLRTRQLEALAAVCSARELVAAAQRDLVRAERTLADAAAGAGFSSTAEAINARLDVDEQVALAAEIDRVRELLRAAQTVVEDEDHRRAAALARPDTHRLAHLHTAAQEHARAAHAQQVAAQRRLERLGTLFDETMAALARWAPVRDELASTARIAGLVEGKSSDNALQMRLSAYVLAHRLAQVVAAANERLARMSDQRYSLEHTGRRGAGESRGGLSLLVRDDWSGETRDPATLSGGETFVVSLALALGLADVITQEAGGSELDTLFVDEGFGSLDAETLEDVMDTLDALRDGGRVVGVVSHVAEMQTRIPSQLRVSKDRAGSRATVRIG